MKKFRIFKQVPRIIFGPNSLDRISELLPDRKSNNDYYVFIIDDVFKEKKIEVRLSVKKNDFIEHDHKIKVSFFGLSPHKLFCLFCLPINLRKHDMETEALKSEQNNIF